MDRFYQHDKMHEPAPLGHTAKERFQMPAYTSHTTRGSPGKTQVESGAHFAGLSPGKMRGHADRKRAPATQKDSDQSLLEMLTSTVACLKQKNMDLEALGCLEQSLWLKRRMFGVDNSVVHRALTEVLLSYNSVAMQYLAQGQFDQCLSMLRKAEAITAPGNFKKCQALQILTFNNIGCCYRKLGKLKSALKYLKEAAQLGSRCAHVKNLSITHLNLCAIQSQLGRHDLALEHAQAAIFHTQEELVSLEDGLGDERDEDDHEVSERGGQSDALEAKNREEKIISLAVAYHNLAVELEFNGRGEASLQWYKKALQLVWKYRETNEALCESFKKIFLDAKKKQKTSNVRQNGIPAAVANARQPLARPKSAYPSSRHGSETADHTNLSYSSTVASQCYKATKPSTAGQHYASPRGETPRGASGRPRRPASATTRQRPLSAKLSTRSNHQHERAQTNALPGASAENTVDLHWKKLEKAHANAFRAPAAVSANANRERKVQRPQSAGSARAPVAHRQNGKLGGVQGHEKLRGELYFAGRDEDIVGNEEDYGVVEDDGDVDDEDEYDFDAAVYDALSSERRGNNQTDRYGGRNAGSRVPNLRPRSAKVQPPSVANSQRHRRTLDDCHRRSPQVDSDQGEDEDCGGGEHRTPEQSSPSVGPTGYSGDDDDTDADLPAQRVSHMEYLRRMKKLAENIKDDLNGVGDRPPMSTPASLAANRAAGMKNSTQKNVGADPSDGNLTNPQDTTPRSATCKVRDRLERVRRDSLDTVEESQIDGDSSLAKEAVANGDSDGIEIWEDAIVFQSEATVRDGERRLFHAAATRRLQAFYRGQRCRTEVREMRETKLRNDAAKSIQRQVREYLAFLRSERLREEQRQQLWLQKEEVENLAVCLIQNLYRRAFNRQPIGRDEPDLLSFYSPSTSRNVAETNATASFFAATTQPPPLYTDTPATPHRSSAASTPRSSHESIDTSQPTPRTCQAAATRIQASARSFAVRHRIALEQAGRLSRMYIERKHFNVALEHALELEQTFLEELSAIKIQAVTRGHQSRLLTECLCAGMHTAASRIQASFRSHRQRILRSTDAGVRSIAARTIQQLYRDRAAHKAQLHQAMIDAELAEVQRIAAISIQNFYRQFASERDQHLEKEEAAMCIQALSRGHLIRKSVQSLRSAMSSSQEALSKHSSAFSMTSSTEKLVEEGHDDNGDRALNINYSFLPSSIRDMYLASLEEGLPCQDIKADREHEREIVELGLGFTDFFNEFETCTNVVVGASALQAMRVFVAFSPDDTKTLSNVVKVAQLLDRRLRAGFWSEDIQATGLALLHAFRDVLDAQ